MKTKMLPKPFTDWLQRNQIIHNMKPVEIAWYAWASALASLQPKPLIEGGPEIAMSFVVTLEFDDDDQLKAKEKIAKNIATALKNWVECSENGLACEDHEGLTLTITVLSEDLEVLAQAYPGTWE